MDSSSHLQQGAEQGEQEAAARLEAMACRFMLDAAFFDDLVHDATEVAADTSTLDEDDVDDVLDAASIEASNINNQGMLAQFEYLLQAGVKESTIAQHIAIAGWEVNAPHLNFGNAVQITIDALAGKQASSFAGIADFSEWLVDSIPAGADCDEVATANQIEAVYLYLCAREAGGVAQPYAEAGYQSHCPGMAI